VATGCGSAHRRHLPKMRVAVVASMSVYRGRWWVWTRWLGIFAKGFGLGRWWAIIGNHLRQSCRAGRAAVEAGVMDGGGLAMPAALPGLAVSHLPAAFLCPS